MNRHFDIAIIGAGPAGSTASLALKESGLSVVLIDKSKFPRDKICGDAIGGHSLKVLKELPFDLKNSMDKLETNNRTNGLRLFLPDSKMLEINYVNHGYVAKRFDFDFFLLDKVKKLNNVEIIENNTVEELNSTKENIGLTLSGGEIITASLIIGCDGAHSIVAKRLANFKVDHRHYSGAVRTYYKNIKGTENSGMLEIHLIKGFLPGYFWIFPLKNNLANVGFGMLSNDIKKRKIDLKQTLKEVIASSDSLRERFMNAELIDDVKGFGLPLGGLKRPISGNRFMLCGDAASLIDPATGEGIGNAMLSGLFAAQQAVKCFQKKDFSASETKNYDNSVYSKLLPELKRNLFIQRFFSRRIWLINLCVSIANCSPKLKNWIVKKF